MRLTALAAAAATVFVIFVSGASAAVLEHRYSFNDGTASDLVGSANGTLASGTISAGSLSGTVRLPTLATADLTGNFTIEDWFTRINSNTDQSEILSFGTNTSNYLLVHPQTPNTSPASLTVEYVQLTGASTIGLLKAPALAPGAEHMLATTYDAGTGTAAWYFDGQLEMSMVIGTFNFSQVASGGKNSIGGGVNVWGDGGSQGSTDEFRIYSGALGSQQILTDFANGANVVPEPASAATLGLCGLLAARRRPRRSCNCSL